MDKKPNDSVMETNVSHLSIRFIQMSIEMQTDVF